MKTFTYTIKDSAGIHARPAGNLVKLVKGLDSKVMIEKGGRRDIFLGTRECQGYVVPCVFGEGKGAYDDVPELAFGLMLHGITYPDEAYNNATKGIMSARFFMPIMKYGVITLPKPEECTVIRPIRKMDIKSFGAEHANFKSIEAEEVD